MWGEVIPVTCDTCGMRLYQSSAFVDESWDSVITRTFFLLGEDDVEADEITACPQCHADLDEGTVTPVSEAK